jgi:hypothetical protein
MTLNSNKIRDDLWKSYYTQLKEKGYTHIEAYVETKLKLQTKICTNCNEKYLHGKDGRCDTCMRYNK